MQQINTQMYEKNKDRPTKHVHRSMYNGVCVQMNVEDMQTNQLVICYESLLFCLPFIIIVDII